MFKSGQSRVAYLLEYIGDEGECRRFLPSLVDQFAETNEQLFSLPNRILIRAILVFVSGDHKALWALTGRGGGNVRRDLFCKFSLTCYFHKVLHQGPIGFKYSATTATIEILPWRLRYNAMSWARRMLASLPAGL